MPIISVSDAVITAISSERNMSFVTIKYTEEKNGRRQEQTVVLVVDTHTLILNKNGIPIPAILLEIGMVVEAVFSSAMTRSLPPQATAYLIKATGNQGVEEMTEGTILNIDRRNKSFLMSKGWNFSNTVQMNTNENTKFRDCTGKVLDFSDLRVGMQVKVRHANFMTASLPPQTTSFEVEVQQCLM